MSNLLDLKSLYAIVAKEIENNSVSLRRRHKGNIGEFGYKELMEDIKSSGEISDDSKSKLENKIEEFVKGF